MRYIEGSIFETIKLKILKFNEGLEHIDGFAFYNQDACKVVIPSTLEDINIGTFNWEKINDLEFTNFKNSKLLYNLLYNNKVPYRELFFKLFTCDINFNIKPKFHKIYLIDENEKKYIIYKNELEFKSVISSNKGLSEVYWNDIPNIRSNFIRVIKQKTGIDFKDYQEEINYKKK